MKGIILFLLVCATFLHANILATVEKVDGLVKIKKAASIKKIKAKEGMTLEAGDIISTYKNAHVVLKTKDNSAIVLDEKATLTMLSENEIAQNNGKIFYKIMKRSLKNRLQIKTQFAIIGIKGTTFIIKAEKQNKYVALKEGVIGITSIKEAFILYKKKVMDEFLRYKQQQIAGFEAYKNKFKNYTKTITKAFDLAAGNVVSFTKDGVIEDPLASKKEFRFFERILQK